MCSNQTLCESKQRPVCVPEGDGDKVLVSSRYQGALQLALLSKLRHIKGTSASTAVL